MKVTAVEAALRDWIGLDAATLGATAITRAVRGRMRALGMTDSDAFAAVVRSDPAERDRLVEDVIVAESWFFRDAQVFAFVADVAVTLAALPGRGPVQILCAPCAAGEEPYSVAMALLDAGLAPGQFVIDAVDVSHAALERARQGRYSANAFRNADVSFRDRWFRQDRGGAVIDPRVRECVRFSWGNLLEAGFAPPAAAYDVVFCRNLLIYLTTEARIRVERLVDGLLRRDGVLVLGAAEPPILKGDWIPAGAASVFAMRRGIHVRQPVAAGGTRSTTARAPTSDRPVRGGAPPSSAGARTSGPAPPDHQPTLAWLLERAGSLANERRYAEAIDLCERHRAGLGPAPELFFLLGVLYQSVGDVDRAEGCFHKTLYLDAGHEEALLALALLARQRGDLRMADTYRQSAARVLARKGSP